MMEVKRGGRSINEADDENTNGDEHEKIRKIIKTDEERDIQDGNDDLMEEKADDDDDDDEEHENKEG